MRILNINVALIALTRVSPENNVNVLLRKKSFHSNSGAKIYPAKETVVRF